MEIFLKSRLCLVIVFLSVLHFIQLPIFSFESNHIDYDSIIVIPKETTLKKTKLNRIKYKNKALKIRKSINNIHIIPLSKEEDTALLISELKKSKLFKIVEPDYKLQLDGIRKKDYKKINKQTQDKISYSITPNDESFHLQYYLNEINAPEAWKTAVSNSLTVAILDTGIDVNHPDLEGKIITTDNENISDEIGHGTEIAGVIAANTNNKIGIAGISWNSKILPIKITDENGETRVSTVVNALEKAYENGAKIVQISLGTNKYSEVLKEAIEKAQSRNILIISSGGNSGTREIRYPAAFNGVI